MCTMMTEVSSEQSRTQFCMHSAAAVAAAAAVRHRVPDGHFCCHLIESDPSVSFHFIQTRLVLMVPLGSNVSPLPPRFAYIFGN